MGQWWKYALRLIAIIAAGAPAAMNVAGCFESFTNPYLKYGAVAVGGCADIYLLASLPALAYFKHKRRKWKFRVGLAIWLACTLWTGLSSGSWLQHKLEEAQAPVEQQKGAQAKTESERQTDLAGERETLKAEEETARTGRTKDVRDNAAQLAEKTRGRISKLEKPNTPQAETKPTETEPKPIKSPFAGYETLVTFLLLALSQGCWFMALDEETAKASGAEIAKPEQVELSSGNEAPLSEKRQRKQPGNGKRKSTGTKPGNEESAQILKFRKPPTKEEILAFMESVGSKDREKAGKHFGYTARHVGNILNGKSRSQAHQAAA
jgi:hypothetical protein